MAEVARGPDPFAFADAPGPTPEETQTLAVLALWVARDVKAKDLTASATGVEVLSRYAHDLEERYGPAAMKRWEGGTRVRENVGKMLDRLEKESRR